MKIKRSNVSLTATERAYVTLLFQGYTIERLADYFGRTTGSIKNVLRRVYSKLEVSSHAELLAKAIGDPVRLDGGIRLWISTLPKPVLPASAPKLPEPKFRTAAGKRAYELKKASNLRNGGTSR